MRAALTILATVTIAGCSTPVFAQKRNAPPPPAQKQSVPQSNSMLGQSGNAPRARLNGPGPHNGDWLRQNGALPPAQQEQKLKNDPVFQSLTPDKQQKLLDRLHVFNSLTPQKKQQVLNHMETYEHLTPTQQQQAQNLFSRYRGLPPDQQSQLSQAYKQLRQMTPEQREQYFNSDEFRNGMNDEQRNLLRGMSELYPNPQK